MKHAGKARQAGVKLIAATFFILLLCLTGVLVATSFRGLLPIYIAVLAGLWVLFVLFAINFFRDPIPNVPPDPLGIVSPAHGTVDVIDEIEEPEFIGGRCKRISIFLSVFDVHVQNAPIAGRIAFLKHCPGQFLNAMRTDCSTFNEHVLIGFDSSERPGEKVVARLIAGLLARRIVPWIKQGDVVSKGERISLIQFGSRVDLCLPLNARIEVSLGAKVKGGETILARRAA